VVVPQALDLVDRLGQRHEFELIIDRAKQFVPILSLVKVVLGEATDDMPPGVILVTHRDEIGVDDDPIQRTWIAAAFLPGVRHDLVLLPFTR
jgi:hypothetical protein